MDFSHLPTDHFAKSTQFTKDLYYDVYPSVDPSTAPLSQRGKVVLITGASSGIGRHVRCQRKQDASVRNLGS
jgi:hypothetical protein